MKVRNLKQIQKLIFKDTVGTKGLNNPFLHASWRFIDGNLKGM